MKKSHLCFLLLLFGGSAIGAEFYVSPAGDDANPGTKDRPLRSLEAARDAARRVRGSGETTIWLRGGDHHRGAPFVLGTSDSGAQEGRVVYRAAPGESPRLIGARVVRAGDFKEVTDDAIRKRLPEAALGHVVAVDLGAMGIRHVDPWPDLFTENGGIIELLFNGDRLPIARWPNEAPATMKRVLDVGDTTRGPGHRGGTFEYRDDRHARWPIAQGVWLRGYWRVPWEREAVRIQSLDPDRHTITLSQPVKGGLGSKYDRPNGSGEERYWALNLPEELDQPGEWFLDFKTRTLYLWPPSPLRDATVWISDMKEPVLQARDASRLTFRGLVLEGGLGNGVEIDGGSDVLVAGCTLRGFGRSGVVVRGGEGHGVRSCDFENLGASGILLFGGDRARLVPARHFAVNNHLHHFSQVNPVFTAGIVAGFPQGAVGMHVAHNLIHDCPHGGILYGGNDNLLELNDIHHMCLVSLDMAGLYTRQDWTSRGNVVRHNYVHDNPGAHGVYCDDGDSGDTITGNVLRRLNAGVFLAGGHDNTVMGNLVVDCKVGVHIDARGADRGYDRRNGGMVERLESIHPSRPPWSERYPELAHLLDFHPELPTGNRIADNVFLRCEKPLARQATPERLQFSTFEKNLELKSDPGFRAPSSGDFRLRPDSDVYRLLPNFRPIPFEAIGLYRDEDRPQLPDEATHP